jgi:hypothetical protein
MRVVHTQERSASYEKALYEKSQIIQRTEMSNMNKRQRSNLFFVTLIYPR